MVPRKLEVAEMIQACTGRLSAVQDEQESGQSLSTCIHDGLDGELESQSGLKQGLGSST